MKIFVEFNNRVKQVDANSAAQLRTAAAKAFQVDASLYSPCFAGKEIDERFALQPDFLVRLVSKEELSGRHAEEEGWKVLLHLAAQVDTLLAKTLQFAVDNGDGVIEGVK